jgi:hypothetical protein
VRKESQQCVKHSLFSVAGSALVIGFLIHRVVDIGHCTGFVNSPQRDQLDEGPEQRGIERGRDGYMGGEGTGRSGEGHRQDRGEREGRKYKCELK